MDLLLYQVEYILHLFRKLSVIICSLTYSRVADTTPAAVVERLTTDPVVVENNVASGELLNPTVNGTTIENKPTVNAITAENNVTVVTPVKPSKEDVKKTPVAASPPPAQKDNPKKHPISASPPPAQKDAIKKTYASIVSSLFYFLL